MKSNSQLLILLFVFTFQPPFIPIPFVYVSGVAVIAYLFYRRNDIALFKHILKKSGLLKMWDFHVVLTLYLIVVNALDIIFVGDKGILPTRLRGINQLFVLTLFQFAFVTFLIIQYEKRNFSYSDGIKLLVSAGILQGLFSIAAFVSPTLRSLFMMFGTKALFENEWFMERRGFGFSMTLIDTFGYGMGLIAGYVVLTKWKNRLRHFLLLALCLILFSIAVNARTGILVFLIAITIKAVYSTSVKQFVAKIIPLLLFLYLILYFTPSLLEIGAGSNNRTISWICSSFSAIFELILDSGASSSSVEELSFLSDFINLPSNTFELIFGAGHYVYDTEIALGFRTDIGFLNMFWEFGLFGSSIFFIVMFLFMIRPYFMTNNISIKRICIFNSVTYFLMLMKAILIGYNPGVFVNYLVTFCIYYYLWKDRAENRIVLNKIAS